MKLLIARESFLSALERCATATEATASAYSQAVLLQADADRLQLSTTNLVLTVDTAISAKSQKTGTVAVNCSKLIALVRALPNEAGVQLEVPKGDDSKLVVTSGTRRYMLATLSAADFPAIAEVPDGATSLTLVASQFRRLSERTEYAADQGRVALNALRMTCGKQTISMMALSSAMFSLATEKAEVAPHDTNDIVDLVIPRPFLKPLRAMMDALGSDGAPTFRLTSTDTHIFAETDTTLVAVLLPNDRFTQWDQLIGIAREGAREIAASVPCIDLTLALRAVTAVRTEDPVAIVLDPEQQTLGLSIDGAEYHAEDAVRAQASVPLAVKCNPAYLSDTLKAVNSNFKLSIVSDANLLLDTEGFTAAVSLVVGR